MHAARRRADHPGPSLGETDLGDPGEVPETVTGAVYVDVDHDQP
jgi:hypothetical protein